MKMTAAQRNAQEEVIRIAKAIKSCTDKKVKASLMRDFRAAAKVAGIDLKAVKRKHLAELKRERKVAARKLTREMRQQILDLVHAQKSMEEITAATGVSTGEVMGTVYLNTVTTRSLRTESL